MGSTSNVNAWSDVRATSAARRISLGMVRTVGYVCAAPTLIFVELERSLALGVEAHLKRRSLLGDLFEPGVRAGADPRHVQLRLGRAHRAQQERTTCLFP